MLLVPALGGAGHVSRMCPGRVPGLCPELRSAVCPGCVPDVSGRFSYDTMHSGMCPDVSRRARLLCPVCVPDVSPDVSGICLGTLLFSCLFYFVLISAGVCFCSSFTFCFARISVCESLQKSFPAAAV